ncbi:hypothetical protein PAQ31011_00849 [Pandoraea aquatica]|uniref:Phage tail protein n=1 Tax=Pandoraea aquatica TaxID=2508290 RepID=A0A5E4SKH8_9BURK|nr:hypothetical protein [Pandoraea aquatica]VVD75513.1 hypothetical protein PAQ31011_00849 [Pandoraea aquatica]
MTTNDFLAFASGASANVLSQADYAALSALLASGFQAGTAQSAQVNKVWRQSSIMAAVLAQLIVDTTGQNAVDDGTTATLLANLKAAVSARSVGVAGASRNAAMTITTVASSATFTADEVVVSSALGGLKYCLSGVSASINLATTGAGGMDTGTAPATGFVALYLIYNPATGAKAMLGWNVTGTPTEIYPGANMPTGYTASSLRGIFLTNASRQFTPCILRDRDISFAAVNVLSTTTNQSTFTSFPVGAVVAPGAVAVNVVSSISNGTANITMELDVASDALGSALLVCDGLLPVVGTGRTANGWVPIVATQTLYSRRVSGGGSPTYSVGVIGYRF